MNKKEPIRLLILEESRNRAEELIVLLRTAGRATRACQIESDHDLQDKLRGQTWDLLLASREARGLTVEQVISSIRRLETDVPVILLAEDREPGSITDGLKLGAADVALADDDERLILLVERELANLDNRRMRLKAEVQLRETDRRNQLLLDSSTAAIAYVHEGMHIYTNRAYATLFGYEDQDELAGIPIIDLIANEGQDKFKKFLKSFADDNDANTEEIICVGRDSARITTNLSLSTASYDGELCTQVIFRTITEDSELEDRIKEISSQDLLTGLYNRQYFIEQLEAAIIQANLGGQNYVLFYILIDRLSRIRSDAGISNADLVLSDLAALVRDQVDESHMIARFGDDVFTLLYKGGDKDAAAKLAEDLRARVEGHLSDVSGKSYQLTVSIGLSPINEGTASSEEVISRGHRAATTITNGNGTGFYEPKQINVGEDGKALSTEDIKVLVRGALENNTFRLVYQPIISLHGDDDEQFEVLLRLPVDADDDIYPDQFLDPADDAGLSEKIDRWVILQSIKVLAKHREQGHRTCLFINITHRSIIDESFLAWVSVALKAARLPSDTITFQLHESDATTYIQQSSRFAQGVEQLHCKTSINHFGRVPNPLNLLKQLTPDYVKLDSSFAAEVEENNEKRKELVALVKALQTRGVLTAICGVETPMSLATLFSAGVHFIQGNYISPPLDDLDYDFGSEAL